MIHTLSPERLSAILITILLGAAVMPTTRLIAQAPDSLVLPNGRRILLEPRPPSFVDPRPRPPSPPVRPVGLRPNVFVPDLRPRGGAPTGTFAAAAGPGRVIVSWVPAPWAEGHAVYSAERPDGPFVFVGFDPAPGPELARYRAESERARALGSNRSTATTRPSPFAEAYRRMVHAPVIPSTTYYYVVIADYADSAKASSNVSAPTTSAPVAITGLVAEQMNANGSGVAVTWDDLPLLPRYSVLRNDTLLSIGRSDIVSIGQRRGIYDYSGDPVVASRKYEVRATYLPQVAPPVVISATTIAERRKIWGYADLHVHQFADLGFGGMGLGITGEPLGMAMGLTSGQVSPRGLERAHKAGLQLITMYAVNTEIQCNIARDAPLNLRALRPKLSCDDDGAIVRQVNAAKALQDSVARAGTPWYQIAYSAAQALQIIRQGHLAVVLGVEVDNVLSCPRHGPSCTAADVKTRLGFLRALGVRQVVPIHLSDNAFGGFALYRSLFLYNSAYLMRVPPAPWGSFPGLWDCSSFGFAWRFDGTPPEGLTQFLGPWAGAALHPIPVASNIPGAAHCNATGLTPLGETFISELIAQKFIIDIDHMSMLAASRTLRIAALAGYPVMTSHSGLLDASIGPQRAEGQRTATQLDTVLMLGGVVAIHINQGTTAEVNTFGQIPNDCSNSSKTWVQVYLRATWRFGGNAVAFGSDVNGDLHTGGPRYGPKACGGNAAQAAMQGNPPQTSGILYAPTEFPGDTVPIPSAVSMGFPDYHTSGPAHVALYPEFIEDLIRLGLTREQYTPLFRSADAFVKMWERIDK